MPGLLDLKTDLKSLKYGNDQPGNGSSNEPYIKVNINNVDRDFNRLRLTKFDDGLIRGGTVGAINASITDTLRIGKFLVDFPKGPLFITKQIGLQLSNPRLESKSLPTNKPTTGGGFFNNVGNFISNTANRIENEVGPTRIYNAGINTLAQIPVNAFGGHIVRHGFTPNSDPSKYYENAVAENAGLTNNDVNYALEHNRLLRLNTKFQNNPAETIIDQYTGGPNSIYGIGQTIIRRASTYNYNNGIITDYSSNYKAGQPLVNGQRQAFTYIDDATFDGAISSDLGQRNRFSDWNKNHYIGGTAYKDKGLTDVFYDTITDPRELAKGVDQSVYNKDYTIPFSKAAIDSKTKDAVKISNSFDYAISNTTGSIFARAPFDLTSEEITQNTSFLFYPASNNDKNNNTKVANSLFSSSIFNDYVANGPNDYPDVTSSINSFQYKELSLPNVTPNIYTNPTLKTYSELISVIDKQNQLTNPDKLVNETYINQFGIYDSTAKSFSNENVSAIGYQNSYGDVITLKGFTNWNNLARENRVGSGRKDSINLTPLFATKDSSKVGNIPDKVIIDGVKYNINDLVKFRIQAINTDDPSSQASWMIFRAYLTDLSDSVDATWNPIKYAGRGDQFYIYDGFTRKMNVSFKVAALSADEMQPMYNKLNYLMSNLMPDYNNNVMRGPMMRMTIGNYIDGQLCILNSLSYKVPQDSPWEIALDEPLGGTKQLILPHVLEVTLGFTPIGSQTRNENKLAEKSSTTSHIAQNWNGGKNGEVEYILPNITDALKQNVSF